LARRIIAAAGAFGNAAVGESRLMHRFSRHPCDTLLCSEKESVATCGTTRRTHGGRGADAQRSAAQGVLSRTCLANPGRSLKRA
jgi:hypothetical protein